MKELYKGKLRFWHLMEAVREMQIIEQEMKELPANMAIWDNDDPKKRPEYSEYGNQEAANLAEYFICTHGDGIFEAFYSAVADALELLRPFRLINLWLE
ncbi:MAG: hypothetical protein HFG27_01785 [Provencibacterium sp.]|jgi:hypothetical protein|nr:hypothetical protein [Provencibacterium sp.]